MTMTAKKGKDGWWRAYGDVISEGYESFIGLEDAAATICDYQPFLVPGLLQTEEYAQALMSACGVGPATADRRVALRRRRQSVLAGESPPQLHVVVEEAVLRRPVGGGETMRAQLERLVAAAARPNVTFQVALAAVGMHPAEGHGFIFLGFPDPAEPGVVYVEHLNKSALVDDAEEVGRFGSAFDSLRAVALPPAESVELVLGLLLDGQRAARCGWGRRG
jgi:hypothetical protein